MRILNYPNIGGGGGGGGGGGREVFLYHFELLLVQNAEAVARLNNLFFSNSIFSGLQLYWKETTAQVFSATFPNFKEHLFCRTSANGCFWKTNELSIQYKNGVIENPILNYLTEKW